MKDKNKFYVYVLMDSSVKMEWSYNGQDYKFKPFYIGMGSGYRIISHGNNTDLKSTKNNFKKDYILKMYNSNSKIIRQKLIENISAQHACKIEINLIKSFGRISNNTGILTNISTGGETYMYGVDNPKSKKIYQYSKEGLFMKEHICIADIKITGIKNPQTGISSSSIRNFKFFPEKVSYAYGFIWLKEYKGESIVGILNQNDKRIYKYSEDFHLLDIYESGRDVEKHGYSDSSIYHSISEKKIYKNCFWSKGKIEDEIVYRYNYDNCKECYQYSVNGNFIKKHDCIARIPEKEGLDISHYSIIDSCLLNKINYPNKIYTAAKYVWMYEYKGQKIKTLKDIRKRKIYQWDSNFNLVNTFIGYDDLEKTDFRKNGVHKSIKTKKNV